MGVRGLLVSDIPIFSPRSAAAGIETEAHELTSIQNKSLDGPAAPGASAVFKVYVVLTTGNEKGSNVVRIVRPG